MKPNKPLLQRHRSDTCQAFIQGGDVVDHAELSLAAVGLSRPLVQQEEALGCSPVLPWHEVVDDGVDGGAEVAEHHGGHVEVLAQHGRFVVVHLSEEVPADVVWQPADDEGQHHHHWGQNKTRRGGGLVWFKRRFKEDDSLSWWELNEIYTTLVSVQWNDTQSLPFLSSPWGCQATSTDSRRSLHLKPPLKKTRTDDFRLQDLCRLNKKLQSSHQTSVLPKTPYYSNYSF